MIGRQVVIRSLGGIAYRGVVKAIRISDDGSEVFELGSERDSEYRRFVHVTDRNAQIREADRDY
jgi:hypothetical protein